MKFAVFSFCARLSLSYCFMLLKVDHSFICRAAFVPNVCVQAVVSFLDVVIFILFVYTSHNKSLLLSSLPSAYESASGKILYMADFVC